MTDGGPFDMTHDKGRPDLERRARELLVVTRQLAERQFADKRLIEAPGIEGASVHERSIISVAIQSIWNAAVEANLNAFNVIDGFAHGIATTFAQYPPELRDAAISLIVNNMRGYEARTRAAFATPERTPDA